MSISLTEATEVVRKHFEGICSDLLTFGVLASLNDARLPYIALRCREHCWLETEFRVHDVVVNRDGTIRSTRQVGVEGKDVLSAFTAG